MRVRFLLSGPLGTVQFLYETHNALELRSSQGRPWNLVREPEGIDLGFHAASPREWQREEDRFDCDVLEQGFCWFDGSTLQAEQLAARFHERGDAVVWETLQDRYEIWLEGRDDEGET